MRRETVEKVARQLGAVVSRRVGMALGIWGEPGIGKTHAAHAILERVPCHHLRLHATASEVQIVRAMPRARTLSGWAQAQLNRLERGDQLEPRPLAQTLAAALGALVPFVLYLEDVHEADPKRLEMIVALAQAVPRTKGVGLLVTSRAELPEPFRNHHLEPLDEQESTVLLEREVGAGLPDEGQGWMRARTRGNPLFVLEFARYLTRQGFLWSDGKHWNWRAPPEDFVPVTVEALLEQFVRGAVNTPDLAAVMSARAMLGPSADVALWRSVSGLSSPAFTAARTALEWTGILGSGDVAHPLYREVVVRSLAPEERRRLARRALESLEDDPEAAAAFVDEAGLEPEQRRAHYQRAAESAEASGRKTQAGRWLARAAEDTQGPLRAVLAHKAATYLSGMPPEAIPLLEVAVSEDPTNTQAVIDLATQYARMGSVAEMNRTLERLPGDVTAQETWVKSLLRIRSGQLDQKGVIALWNEHPELHTDPDPDTAYWVGFAHMELGDAQRAEALAQAAFQKPDLSPLQKMKLLFVCGLARRLNGDLETARSFLDEAVACARLGGPADLASSLNNRQIVLRMLGLYPETVADLKEAIQLYRNAGMTLYYASSLSSLGSLLGNMGQYEEAEARLLEAHEALLLFDHSGYLCTNECILCELYLTWRPPHGLSLAQRYARLAVERARPLEPRRLGYALCVASSVANALGQADQSLALANECLRLEQINADVRVGGLAAKAAALEALGSKTEAISALESACSIAIREHHELDLELARLRNDLEAARTTLVWFRERGLMGVVDAALRKWPELAQGEASVSTHENIASARITVLGPMALERDGQPVPTRARKRLEILAYLLETRIAGRAGASALELVDALYSDADEPEARNTLKQQVYLIRSSFGAESVISTPTGYALGAVSSDAEEVLRSNQSSLWRGPYLSGLGEGWLAGVRESLVLSLRATVESLLGSDPSEAARLGAILCEMEPYDADALRLVVRALEAAGDARGASRVFQEGLSRLHEIGEPVLESMDVFVT